MFLKQLMENDFFNKDAKSVEKAITWKSKKMIKMAVKRKKRLDNETLRYAAGNMAYAVVED